MPPNILKEYINDKLAQHDIDYLLQEIYGDSPPLKKGKIEEKDILLKFEKNKHFHTTTNLQEMIYKILILRKQGMPLTKIFERKYFWNNYFVTNEYTLDPRQETEILVEEAMFYIERLKEPRILDLGTGTGCIIISLLEEFDNAHGTAVDISSEALKIAEKNADLILKKKNIRFIESDWFENVPGKYDIIISNPPYISHNEIIDKSATFDPAISLYADMNGLSNYEVILDKGRDFIIDKGLVILEIGFSQRNKVINIAENYDWKTIKSLKDLSGNDRALVFQKI